MAANLSHRTRTENLREIDRAKLDLLVIGGGITGSGIARDAAIRGLAVAMVERVDFGYGTSSRSSKLIHCGLRYLQQGEIGLVLEAAAERAVLSRLAPHLAERKLMVLPARSLGRMTMLRAGLRIFDTLARIPRPDLHVNWAPSEVATEEPGVRRTRLRGAVVYPEYVTDDARLVMATVLSAHEEGALVVNYAEAEGIAGEGELTAVFLRDRLTGAEHRARARVVVNAAGPWVDRVRAFSGPVVGKRLHLTKGVHLVYPREKIPLRNIVVMESQDKRPVFAVPRGDFVYLGTTDTDYAGDAEEPEISTEDAEYLLAAARTTFDAAIPGRAEAVAAWSGVRPLLQEGGKRPSEISRRDEVLVDPTTGMISIAGGKLTTYRQMAKRVVDRVVDRLATDFGKKTAGPCQTADRPLAGGGFRREEMASIVAQARSLAGAQLSEAGASRLVRLHGRNALVVAKLAAADAELARPLDAEGLVLGAEVVHAVEREMAMTLTDFLERRSALSLFGAENGLGLAETVAAILGERLGWSQRRRGEEIAGFRGLMCSRMAFAKV